MKTTVLKYEELLDKCRETVQYILQVVSPDTNCDISIENGLALVKGDLEEAAALLDDFETEQAIKKLKSWISNPLEQDMREHINNVLIALEDEFDEDTTIKLLREERR